MAMQGETMDSVPQEFLTKLQGLLALLVEYPITSPLVRKKIETLWRITVAQTEIPEAEVPVVQVFEMETRDSKPSEKEVPLEGVRETIQELILKIPYLSLDQQDALREDLDDLLELWEGVQTDDDRLEEAVEKINARVHNGFVFSLDSVPVDTFDSEKIIPPVYAAVIDIFGGFINSLALADGIRLDFRLSDAIVKACSPKKEV